MPSDAIERKTSYLLALCDQDDDGVLDADDFAIWVERLAAIRGWEQGSEGYADLEATFLGSYDAAQAARGGEEGRVGVADGPGAVDEDRRTDVAGDGGQRHPVAGESVFSLGIRCGHVRSHVIMRPFRAL